MRQSYLFALLIPAVALFAACTDEPTASPEDDTNTNGPTGKLGMLVDKPWKTTFFTIKGHDSRELHYETTTFLADGTVTGVLPNGKSSEATWSFNPDSTILTVDLPPGANWTVLELTETSFKGKDDNEEAGTYALPRVWHAVAD